MTIGSVRGLFREQLHTHCAKWKLSNTTFLIRLSSKKSVLLTKSRRYLGRRRHEASDDWLITTFDCDTIRSSASDLRQTRSAREIRIHVRPAKCPAACAAGRRVVRR